MNRTSIRLRLWSAAAVSIIVALAIAGVGLRYLFERHVERRVEADLTIDLSQLIGATAFGADGVLAVAPALTNPRFATPLSGYYWQVEDLATHRLLRSRSLWDTTLALPVETNAGARHIHEINGPGSALVLVVERTIVEPGGRSFRAAVAEDHRTITESVDEYVQELMPAIVLLAVVLLIAIFLQITVGLAPLENLRVAVRKVVARRSARIDVAAPTEVQPLADEINRLLEAQEKALVRARSRATDLAHGLKTPLQVLAGDIRALRAKGETELAGEIEKSVGAIRRHIERELARSRVAPGVAAGSKSRVAEAVAGIFSVVKRTPGAERLAFILDAPEDPTAPVDEGDLSEILGNLIENAARFAVSTVRVTAKTDSAAVVISVIDDGPGIADADRAAALARGVQLDAHGGGTGLGLAIVSDIVTAYGGTLVLTDAAPGLNVTVTIPPPPA